MAVTLEQTRALSRDLRVFDERMLCKLLRAHGVRRRNLLLNTGQDKYAFNAVQVKSLPVPTPRVSLSRATSSSSGKTGRASDGVGPAARHAPPAAQAGGGRGLPVPPTGGRGRGTARREAIRRARRSRLIRSSPGRQVEPSSERRCWSPCRDAVRHYKDEAGGAARVFEAHGIFTPLEEIPRSATRLCLSAGELWLSL